MNRLDVKLTSEECAWESASSAHPCPVCGADGGCQIHDAEGFVCCTQVRSEWPLTTGAWLHREPTPRGRAAPASQSALPSPLHARAALARRFDRLYSERGRGS
jgi:hypothetical protein